MQFTVHKNLAKNLLIKELSLCSVFLEDDRDFIWLILVPRKENCSKLIDLSWEDQVLLLKELNQLQNLLWKEFKPTQLNVAAIGNKTDQLHIHLIVRHEKDKQWPATVWDKAEKNRYSTEEKENLRCKLLSLFAMNE